MLTSHPPAVQYETDEKQRDGERCQHCPENQADSGSEDRRPDTAEQLEARPRVSVAGA